MLKTRTSTFELVLLIVGIGAAILGFQLINQVYGLDGKISWLMVIAIFNWLMLLILFILLSITVDVSKKQLAKMETLVELFSQKKVRSDKIT